VVFSPDAVLGIEAARGMDRAHRRRSELHQLDLQFTPVRFRRGLDLRPGRRSGRRHPGFPVRSRTNDPVGSPARRFDPLAGLMPFLRCLSTRR